MRAATHKPIVEAMVLMVIAMLLIPAMDITAKWLAVSFNISPATSALARFITQTILMYGIIVIRTKSLYVSSRQPFFNFVRGLLIASASMIFFTAVKYMPVADAISIFFVEPIIVMLLSSALLGENLGWRRLSAAAVGFFGAMLVIQPSFENFGWISLLPLCTALLFSVYLVLTRKFGRDDAVFNMQFYSGVGGIAFCVVAMSLGKFLTVDDLTLTIPTSLEPAGWLLVVGIIATFTHILIVRAFTIGSAIILAPFQYVEIISATLLGFLIFGDFPNALKWLGIGIIILSGLFIFWREHHLSTQE